MQELATPHWAAPVREARLRPGGGLGVLFTDAKNVQKEKESELGAMDGVPIVTFCLTPLKK